jgi:hypothetical protein
MGVTREDDNRVRTFENLVKVYRNRNTGIFADVGIVDPYFCTLADQEVAVRL